MNSKDKDFIDTMVQKALFTGEITKDQVDSYVEQLKREYNIDA